MTDDERAEHKFFVDKKCFHNAILRSGVEYLGRKPPSGQGGEAGERVTPATGVSEKGVGG